MCMYVREDNAQMLIAAELSQEDRHRDLSLVWEQPHERRARHAEAARLGQI